MALRARIILECSKSENDTKIAENLGVSRSVVNRWRNRFAKEEYVECLHDAPRPGTSRKLSDEQVNEVVIRTFETKPENSTHWSTRKMASKVGLSSSSVARIWRSFGLKPHLRKTFKLSTDPFFVEKVRDIVGLYMKPLIERWFCAWMKKVRFRLWTEPNPCCLCALDRRSVGYMITCEMEQPRYSPRWMSQREKFWENATKSVAIKNF